MTDNLLEEAGLLVEQGRLEEARAPLQRLLATSPANVPARQMLIQAQLASGHADEARALLVEGQRLMPEQTGFTLSLARMRADAGDLDGAIQMLEAGRPSARNDPEFHALLAALLVRSQRYDEAVQDYLVALRTDPANGHWLVGIGVALEGIGKPVDALEAYRRAEGAPNLPPALGRFVAERIVRLTR